MQNFEIKILDDRLAGYSLQPQTEGSAAIDLRAFFDPDAGDHGRYFMQPGETQMFGTGLSIWIRDPALVGLVVIRSSVGKRGIVLANQVGVIDSDYQGEIKVMLRNDSMGYPFFENGERVAQLLIMPVVTGFGLERVEKFSERSQRGDGGIGSTGTG